jgi:glycosyltransferase involved in cell wall biosynthesis
MKDLYIIFNERVYYNNKNYFCENKDIQSIVNYLSHKYSLIIISRYSAFVRPFKLNVVSNFFYFRLAKIFNFLIFLFNLTKEKKKILIISITLFNFVIFLIFKIFFNCKFYLYLRSNGYEEYDSILGKKYIWIYDFMFKYMTKSSEVISCHKRLYSKKCHILNPSELNSNWSKKVKKSYYKNNIIDILYVGRFKVEKGIYSLLNIFSDLPTNIKLKLVGSGDSLKINDNRIKLINFIHEEKKLINIFDTSNITILPSYTEAHPKVIDESLSRMRPVIIFNDIKYVIQNRYGIFSVKRNSSQLLKIINYIKKKQKPIHSQMKKNKLPKKINFLQELYEIISCN